MSNRKKQGFNHACFGLTNLLIAVVYFYFSDTYL